MSKEPYPSETADRFIVRFPDGMRDRIKEAAAANNRSMNAEIIARLESTFAPVEEPQVFTRELFRKLIAGVDERLDKIESKIDAKLPGLMDFKPDKDGSD